MPNEGCSRQCVERSAVASVLNEMHYAARVNVERALAFITACQVDVNCVLESGEPEDVLMEESNDKSTYMGLKIGIALGFIPMTILSSFIPVLFMNSKFYGVRIHWHLHRQHDCDLKDAMPDSEPGRARILSSSGQAEKSGS
jgi:hypothetical protein